MNNRVQYESCGGEDSHPNVRPLQLRHCRNLIFEMPKTAKAAMPPSESKTGETSPPSAQGQE